jgi:hypothetical protein
LNCNYFLRQLIFPLLYVPPKHVENSNIPPIKGEFIGLAPEKHVTPKHQLQEFSRQISRGFKTSKAIYEDWSDAFSAVGERVQTGKILLFFDELSWMGDQEPTFLAKIKNLWDLSLCKNPNLIFIVSSTQVLIARQICIA